MKKRGIAYTLAGFGLLLVLLAGSVVMSSADTRAAVPVSGASSGVAAMAAPQPVAPKPAAPNVSTWTDIAPFPTVTIDFTPVPTSLKLKRANAAAYPSNGKIYVMGGRHGTDGEDINMRSIYEYTPGSPGTWLTKTALLDSSQPGSRWTANMAVVVLTDATGVRIYAIGGNNINSEITSTVRIYNPVADSLSTLTTDPWPANPARIPGGYTVYNNKLYIFGGFSALGSGAVFGETWVFDPMGATGSKWSQLTNASLPLARGYIAGAALDGKIYAVGGDTWNSATRALVPVTNVEVLDPALPNNGWTPVASLPSARGDMSAWAYDTGTGYEISGSLVVEGGVYPVPDGKGFQYRPLTNTWNSFTSLTHATRNYGAAQLNGFLYAFGGYDYSGGLPAGANFNQRYDATGAAATSTNTPLLSPTPTSTPNNTNYNICQLTGATLVPGTTLVPSSSCGDCVVGINLPFPYQFYDQTFNAAKVAVDGTIGFVIPDGNLVNTCLPDLAANYAIFPYWDDLDTTGAGQGIYTSISGVAPNRVFNIEWRATRAGGSSVNFEVRLYEGQTQLDIIYAAVSSGGNSATVGVQRDSGSLFNQFSCNTASLSAGLQLTFAMGSGVCPSPTPTFTSTRTPTNTSTVTGTPPTATATNTPTATPCGPAVNYQVSTTTGAGIVAGTTDVGNHGDDVTTSVVFPFTVRFYGASYSTANISSNGNLQFTSNANAFQNACLPASNLTDVILPLWDDLRTDGTNEGVFTSVTGVAPNRILNVEWRAEYFNGGTAANFEARLYEGQDRIDFVYGQTDGGSSTTVGVQQGTGTSLYTQFSCNTATLSAGLQITFTQPPCQVTSPTATNTPGGPTFTSTSIPTRTLTPTLTPTATITSTATPTVCGPTQPYVITQSTGAALVAGTTDTGNHCDDCSTTIALPFSVSLYDQSFTSADVTSNGQLDFLTTDTNYSNSCLPDTAASYAIFPHWDDMRTDTQTGCSAFASGCGIFTSLSGSAPNRVFNVEWRAVYFGSLGTAVNFEVRLYEGSSGFDVVYGQVGQSGSSATVGVQQGTGPQNTQFECNTGGLSAGLQLAFRQVPCGSPTPVPTSTSTVTATASATETPQSLLVGHVTWQGRPAQPNALDQLPITLTLRPQAGGADTNFTGMTTDASGNFTVPLGTLPNGAYNWRAKGPQFLSNSGPVTLAGAPVTNVEMGTMRAGDCNNDNVVNVTDFGILKNSFGKAVGDPGYDARADFSGDNRVNITDFNLLKNNFGTSGTPPMR